MKKVKYTLLWGLKDKVNFNILRVSEIFLKVMNGLGDKKIRINEPSPISFSPYNGQLSVYFISDHLEYGYENS